MLYISEYSTASLMKLIISFNKPIHNLMNFSKFGYHGVERVNQDLKYGYLLGKKNCSLSELLSVLLFDFLPQKYQRYMSCSNLFRVLVYTQVLLGVFLYYSAKRR